MYQDFEGALYASRRGRRVLAGGGGGRLADDHDVPVGSSTCAIRSPHGWSAGSARICTPAVRSRATAASQSSAYTHRLNRSLAGAVAAGSRPMPRCDSPSSRAT